MTKAEEFFKAIRENPEIRAYLKDHDLPDGMSETEGLMHKRSLQDMRQTERQFMDTSLT